MGGRRVFRIMFIRCCFRCRRVRIWGFLSLSLCGRFLFVSFLSISFSLRWVVGFGAVKLIFADDAEYLSQSVVVNGAACHTMHHLYFNYNYGQFLTFWDRLNGTYRTPKEDGFIQNENRKAQALKQA